MVSVPVSYVVGHRFSLYATVETIHIEISNEQYKFQS